MAYTYPPRTFLSPKQRRMLRMYRKAEALGKLEPKPPREIPTDFKPPVPPRYEVPPMPKQASAKPIRKLRIGGIVALIAPVILLVLNQAFGLIGLPPLDGLTIEAFLSWLVLAAPALIAWVASYFTRPAEDDGKLHPA